MAVAGEVNAHLRNPGSHLATSRLVPRRRVVFDSRGPLSRAEGGVIESEGES